MAGVPALSPRWIERELARRLGPPSPPNGRAPRVIRWIDRRGLVEIDVSDLPRARTAFNARGTGPAGEPIEIATRRTWGTLRKGKRWLDAGR